MTDPARIRQAVLDWVREDCGQAIKMGIQRHHIERLVERICNPTAVYNGPFNINNADRPAPKKRGRPKKS